jgi:hypothetical protein
VAIAVAAVAAVPLLVLAARLITGGWMSVSDWASIELRTRDVGTSHTPLVGPFSRYQWNHPGPLLFYALALPYRLIGSEGTGILFGALVINTIALACIGVLLWRRGRLPGLLLGLALVLVLVRALDAGFLVTPWNPFVIVFPMLAVVVLAWSAIEGDHWALPVAIVLASFAVQSHVGAALGVLAPLAVAVVYLRRELRLLAIAAAVGLACWLPALVEQVKPHGGNLSELVRFWTDDHRVVGYADGAKLVAPQLSIPAPWMTGHQDASIFTGGVSASWHVPYALALLIGALVVAVRRCDRQSTALCSLALALTVAGWLSAARVVDEPLDYIVQWLWLTGPVVWLAILWTAWRALPTEWPERALGGLGAVGAAALTAVLVAGAVHADYPVPNDERSLEHIAADARDALEPLPEPVLVTGAPDLMPAFRPSPRTSSGRTTPSRMHGPAASSSSRSTTPATPTAPTARPTGALRRTSRCQTPNGRNATTWPGRSTPPARAGSMRSSSGSTTTR